MSLTYTTTNILCTATDVGMHGLLASQSCYHSVLPPCLSTVADFFIAKQTSLHPFDYAEGGATEAYGSRAVCHSVIMPRAELRRHTVVVLSVILSATHISSFAENQALKLATQAEIDI